MDPFPDFGLFELIVATGAAALARRIYTRQWLAIGLIVLSLITPTVLIFISSRELSRWLAAVCLAISLVNSGLIITLMKMGQLRILLDNKNIDKQQ
jgi:hypothetical protein